MTLSRLFSTLSFWFVLGLSCLSAQGIVTDRPDFTESGVTVPQGILQLESGLTLETAGTLDNLILGEVLIRWGVVHRLEARVELPSYNRSSVNDPPGIPSFDGFGDSGLGAKYQIGPLDSGGTFDLAVLGMVSIPTGSDEFTSDAVEPEAGIAASKSFGDGDFSLSGQLSASLPEIADERHFEWGATVVSSATLGSITPFLEFRFVMPEDITGTQVTIHSGAALALNSDLQVDVHAAGGLANTVLDNFVGAGVSVRF